MDGAILVVDDNGENRELARATLEDEGVRVVLASNGTEAIAAFEREQPECILLDIRMPGLDGMEVCERIRVLPGGDRVAIIFMTAQRDVETFDRATRGGDDFMTKPFRPAELLVRIRTAVQLRRLSAENTQLAGELKHQRDQLQRLQLQKEQLAAFLVHDLKNPVNTIELQAQRVLRNSATDARSRDAVGKIVEETRSLLRMITILLDINKADEGQLSPVRERVEIKGLVEGVLGELATHAAAAAVRLRTEVGLEQIEVDRELVHRLLVNLTENAIRHAPESSEVVVTIARTDGASEIRVRDGGMGVPQDEHASVFERFVSTGSKRTNRGLGLAFCKLVAEVHGGKIWIEDAHPGAIFCVRIPDEH